MRWIKASERLPEEGEFVHIIVGDKPPFFKFTAAHEDGQWFQQNSINLYYSTVIWLDENAPDPELEAKDKEIERLRNALSDIVNNSAGLLCIEDRSRMYAIANKALNP